MSDRPRRAYTLSSVALVAREDPCIAGMMLAPLRERRAVVKKTVEICILIFRIGFFEVYKLVTR